MPYRQLAQSNGGALILFEVCSSLAVILLPGRSLAKSRCTSARSTGGAFPSLAVTGPVNRKTIVQALTADLSAPPNRWCHQAGKRLLGQEIALPRSMLSPICFLPVGLR